MSYSHRINNTRVGIIVPVRYNSKRLPGKALIKIKGKCVLQYIYERLLCVKGSRYVVIATSNEPDDDLIVGFCFSNYIPCFRGSKNNVAERILQCAERYNFDYFVRICGDNVLTDYQIIDRMIDVAIKKRYDFVSNIKGRTFPVGISVEILKTSFYRDLLPLLNTSYYREHVTAFLYENKFEYSNHYYFFNDICPDANKYKMALDDAKDLEFLTKIINRMNKDHSHYLLEDIYIICNEITPKQD